MGVLTKLLAKSHGAAGAIFLLLAFEQAKQFRSYPPYYKQAVDLAALAVFRHDVGWGSKKIFKRKHIYWEREPISALLYLVDQLHELGRISLEPTVKWPNVVEYRAQEMPYRKRIKLESHGNVLTIFVPDQTFAVDLQNKLTGPDFSCKFDPWWNRLDIRYY